MSRYSSSRRTCWLTAAADTRSSEAAATKLPRRAEASKARSALSGRKSSCHGQSKNNLASGEKPWLVARRVARRPILRCRPTTRMRAMHLFDYLDSGNGYKVRLLLAQLGQKYDWTDVDIDKGLTRTPEFLKRNPNGRIPTLELDDGTNLPESNAILWYLAEGSRFVPATQLGRAQVLQWMFFEQYSHEPYVATPRYICRHFRPIIRAARSCRSAWRRAAPRSRSWSSTSPRASSSSTTATASRTSRCMPTRTSPKTAATISRHIRNLREWLGRVAAQPGYMPLLAPADVSPAAIGSTSPWPSACEWSCASRKPGFSASKRARRRRPRNHGCPRRGLPGSNRAYGRSREPA